MRICVRSCYALAADALFIASVGVEVVSQLLDEASNAFHAKSCQR